MKKRFNMAHIKANYALLTFFSGLLAFSGAAMSQTDRSIALGPFDLNASVLLKYAEDDNLYQSREADAVETSVYTVLPTFGLLFDNGVSGLALNYALEDVTFSEADGSNYTDQHLSLVTGTLIGDIHRLEFSSDITETHERQAVADSPSNSDPGSTVEDRRLDYFKDIDYQLTYRLGNDESLLNLSLEAGQFEREYYDNRSVTRAYDREESRWASTLTWNVSPDLSVGVTYAETEIEYVIVNPSRDGDESVTALTLVWKPSEVLSADIQVGRVRRESDDNDTNDSDYRDINLRWSVLSYSVITLSAASYLDESATENGSFTLLESIGIAWAHDWTERLRTELSFEDATIDYLDDTRQDDSQELYAHLSYQFRERVNVGVFYEKNDRHSNSFEDYDQVIYGIDLLLQL